MHHTVRTYIGVEVWRHTFLISVLDDNSNFGTFYKFCFCIVDFSFHKSLKFCKYSDVSSFIQTKKQNNIFLQNWKRRAKRLAVKGTPGTNVTNIPSMEAGKYKTPASKSKFINKHGGRGQQQQAGGVSAGRPTAGSGQQPGQIATSPVGNATVSPQTPADSK
jgi:hypothetical protein